VLYVMHVTMSISIGLYPKLDLWTANKLQLKLHVIVLQVMKKYLGNLLEQSNGIYIFQVWFQMQNKYSCFYFLYNWGTLQGAITGMCMGYAPFPLFSSLSIIFTYTNKCSGIVTICRELTSQFLLKHTAISSLLLYVFLNFSLMLYVFMKFWCKLPEDGDNAETCRS
jgi:hypothetical protein